MLAAYTVHSSVEIISMRRSRILSVLFGLVVCLCAVALGCGGRTPARTERPQSSLPSVAPAISLADLLAKPRVELASLFDETWAQVQIREKAHRDGSLAFALLPQMRVPLIVPVWAEATYSAKAKISLPPYAVENAKDNHLAMHLARFGDTDAARQLVEDGDQAVRRAIDGLAYERGYPAEWTRLVALMLHTAEYRLAAGDAEGRAELASLHNQLRELLDAKAAKGPLGAALLGQGHKVLSLASAEWRQTGHPDLADKADADLATWGALPAPAVAVPFGASSYAVADILRSQTRGHAVAALNTNRALDLLELPVTGEGVQGVVAVFDAGDKLFDVLVIYRPRIADYYLEPAQFVLPLEDHGIPGKDTAQTASVHPREYRLGQSFCRVSVVPTSNVLGAYVRFAAAEQPPVPVLSRDFGLVNMDRSFGQNRVRMAPEQVGDSVQTSKGPSLAKLTNPLAPLAPTTAVLRRDGWSDLVKSFTLLYNIEEFTPTTFQMALPLWSAFGPARIEPSEDKEGGSLLLSWQDASTRYTLRLPHVSGRAFEFEVADARDGDSLASRATAAVERDAAERRARLENRQPHIRIPRRLEIGWSNTPVAVSLGMTREQVTGILPRGKTVAVESGPDAVGVLFTGDPPQTATRAMRQVFIRFGPDQRVAEIRARTVAGPAGSPPRWINELLAGLPNACGAALESQSSWPTIWNDLPAHKPTPVLGRWQDDISWMTIQRDGTTVETTLHNCPIDQPAGVTLPPFAYLPRGPEGVALGDARPEVIALFKVEKPRTLDDGGIVLTPPRGSGYDVLILWFEKDHVNRIIARSLSLAAAPGKQPLKIGDQITQVWGRNIRAFGWPTRQDAGPDGGLQTLGWHDDLTRIRIFAQDTDDGQARVFTEWKEIPGAK
jgi:hypothetical protein